MKFFIGILIIAVCIGAVWYFLFSPNGKYATTDYYVKITQQPEKKAEKASDGVIDTFYIYKVTGVTPKGEKRALKLEIQKLLEKGKYYLIRWEEGRSISSDEKKVSAKNIPPPALKNLK